MKPTQEQIEAFSCKYNISQEAAAKRLDIIFDYLQTIINKVLYDEKTREYLRQTPIRKEHQSSLSKSYRRHQEKETKLQVESAYQKFKKSKVFHKYYRKYIV